jgi:hypothetical protein
MIAAITIAAFLSINIRDLSGLTGIFFDESPGDT